MTDKERKLKNYREKNKEAVYGQVVFAGSSLMEMFPINKLLEEHGDDTIIYNRGIGGYVTNELLQVTDVCITDLKPKKVFLNIGTNDLSNPQIPISQMIENYDRILCKIEEALPQTVIYLMAYYPVNYEAAAAVLLSS